MWCSQVSLTTCIFFILYRICTEYTVYWKFTCTQKIISMLQLYEFLWKLDFFMVFILCFHRTFDVNTLGSTPSPCCPTWTLGIHPGSWHWDSPRKCVPLQTWSPRRFPAPWAGKVFFWWAVDWIAIQYDWWGQILYYIYFMYIYIHIVFVSEELGGKFVCLEDFCGEISADQ